ncbi:MAG: hypothetical protein AAB460_00270 [Patescibacteria group bacterium]
MKQLTNALSRGNLTAREKFLMLIKNEMHRAKTGKDILTPADKDALENWHAKDNAEAREWNTLNEGWKHSGRMDLEIELLYKDAQVAHLAQLPFIMELVGYPVTQRMEGAITTLKQIKKVTVAEAAEIAKKQREVKLKEGVDFDYAVYQLAFELLSLEEKKRMKELYEEVEYDHQYLDQEEVIAGLFNGKNELTHEAQERLAELVAEKSYNNFAKEYQLYHYFACIPLLEVAKYFLKSKGIEIPVSKDDDGLYESDEIKKVMEAYAAEHHTTIRTMLKDACLAALESGLLDEYTPLVVSTDAKLFERWISTKEKARGVLKKHIDAGDLTVRGRTDAETRKEKLYSKDALDGELALSKHVLENIGLETAYKGEVDERIAFETFSESVITGESLYAFKGRYKFVTDFKKRADTYDPNLGIVYADDDPEHKGDHLDQELLICGHNAKGEPTFFSRYGMSMTLLSNIFEGTSYFKETREGGKTYLEFKDLLYEALFRTRRITLMDGYAQLLAFEAVFKKLDDIYEADMSEHVSERIKAVKEFIESDNDAVRVATNTQEGDLERINKGPFRRKDKLYLKEDWIIDVESIKPDETAVEKHVEKLRDIFGKF